MSERVKKYFKDESSLLKPEPCKSEIWLNAERIQCAIEYDTHDQAHHFGMQAINGDKKFWVQVMWYEMIEVKKDGE